MAATAAAPLSQQLSHDGTNFRIRRHIRFAPKWRRRRGALRAPEYGDGPAADFTFARAAASATSASQVSAPATALRARRQRCNSGSSFSSVSVRRVPLRQQPLWRRASDGSDSFGFSVQRALHNSAVQRQRRQRCAPVLGNSLSSSSNICTAALALSINVIRRSICAAA